MNSSSDQIDDDDPLCTCIDVPVHGVPSPSEKVLTMSSAGGRSVRFFLSEATSIQRGSDADPGLHREG